MDQNNNLAEPSGVASETWPPVFEYTSVSRTSCRRRQSIRCVARDSQIPTTDRGTTRVCALDLFATCRFYHFQSGAPAMNMKDGTMAMPGEMPAKKQTMDSMDMSRNRGTGMSTASSPVKHGPDRHGKGNTMVAEFPSNRLSEPGDGLENNGRRVLVYTDLRSLSPYPDQRTPEREVELHLTGVMDRYMWSFDGKKFSEVDGPVHFKYGERLRLVLVNDTMMEHPIHLHGMWMELENGAGEYRPRKHTLNVKPGERLTALISADAPGNWAFHCHLLYHLDMGMFRVVSVTNDAVSSENRNG